MNGAHARRHWDGVEPPPAIKLPGASVTAWGVVLLAWTGALTLVSTGWLTVPAKDSDLQGIAQQLELVRTDMARISTDLGAIRTAVQGNREDIIRVLTLIDERRSKKASPFKTTLER